MTKLNTLFAIIALSTTLGVAGCKKKNEEQKVETPSAQKAQETTPAGTPEANKPAEGQAAALPTECTEYKAAIDKLATCDKLPQAQRDQLKKSYDDAAAGWANVPAEAKANLGATCKSGLDAVTTAAKQTCGW
jgi:hypothetical protein